MRSARRSTSTRTTPTPCGCGRKSRRAPGPFLRVTGDTMIARIRGTVADRHPGLVVVDVGGVGYELTIPLSTYRHLGEIGSPVELHVHTHVREDTLALFGFASRIEKDLFVRLVAVNGV